jgi:hypothetical protein
MMSNQIARLAPLSGIVFVAVMIGVISFEGEEVDASASADEILAYWAERADTRLLVASLASVALLFLLTFAASLRGALRAREPSEASASAVSFAGAIVAASGLALSATATLAASRAGGDGSADAVVALNGLVDVGWLPITAGFAVMLLASGVGGLRSGALPKVMCWAALVLGVAFLTPAGIVAFLITPLWIIAASVLLFRAQSRKSSMATAEANLASSSTS